MIEIIKQIPLAPFIVTAIMLLGLVVREILKAEKEMRE
jgi:hypothetical protein